MAWRSKGIDNQDLIRKLKESGVIASNEVEQAMLATDRTFYATSDPYLDAEQSIGFGSTISAPHMNAFALEFLRDRLRPGARILDVGSGSGYLTACLLRVIEYIGEDDNTQVVGIEHQPELVALSQNNLNVDDPRMLESGKIVIVEGDGRDGCPAFAPYDAIHVGAAPLEIRTALIEQLANNGRLLVPVGPEGGDQFMHQYDKDEYGNVKHSKLMAVRFEALTDLKRD